MANTITSATKINLGMLGTLLVGLTGGALFVAKLDTNVETLIAVNEKMVDAIDRNTAQLARNVTSIAVLDNRVKVLEKD